MIRLCWFLGTGIEVGRLSWFLGGMLLTGLGLRMVRSVLAGGALC